MIIINETIIKENLYSLYPMISLCVDSERVFDTFTQKGLDFIENILKNKEKVFSEYLSNPVPEYEKEYGESAIYVYYDRNSEYSRSYVIDWYFGNYNTDEFIKNMKVCYPQYIKSQ